MKTFLIHLTFYSLVLTGCSTNKSQQVKLSEKQTMLTNGYAQMYSAMNSLTWTDKIFLVKFETDKVEEFGRAITKNAKTITSELENLKEFTPWMDLKNTGAPEIGKRKLSAVTQDRLKSFLPVVGRSGPNFERTLLLSNSAVLNQMLHLAEVMLEIETNKTRTNFLNNAKNKFETLYKMDIQLLNDHYFCHDTSEESKKFN